jgi:ABC-2 type transport system permease protein
MIVLAMAAASLRRFARDRAALFFFVALPVLLIVILGATVSGFDEFRVGVVDRGSGPLGRSLVAELDRSPAIAPRRFDDIENARSALRRAEVESVVVLPAAMDAALRDGTDVAVTVYADRANTDQQAALSAVAAVVDDQAARIQAAVFATEQAGGTFDGNLELVAGVAAGSTPVTIELEVVDAESDSLPEGFSYSAPTMLVLFVFINAMAGGAAMIQSRTLGIYDRMLAGPVTARAIVQGETTTYLALTLLQSLLIVGVGALLFGVDWGNPIAAGALVALWALVGTGAGMLSGSVFRTPEQASSIGPAVGMVAGMLGGCMWPLAIVPSALQTIGHVVPHAWAVDAWTTVLSRGGGLVDIATELAVLAAFALGLLMLATVRLRRGLLA